MNLCFILLTFYFLLQAYKERVLNKNADHKYVYLAALTFGLNLGIHHITVILMAPAFLYIMLKTTRYSFFKTKKMLLSFIFLLLGISTYSYLILASRNKPILNWGNPDNLERFLRHVSAWQYRSNISINPAQVSNEFKDYISLHIQQFGFIAVLIIIAGLIIAFKDKFLRYLFILVLICNLSYGVLYSIAEDKDAYYLPTYAFECILFSLTVLKYCKSKNKSLKLMIYLISVGSILIPFQSKIQILPKNDYYIGEKYVNDTLASMPQAGIFLTQDWQIYAPLFYFQQVYSKRPDIIAIDVNLLKRSWYVEYIYQHYPEIAKYSKAEIESFLQQVVKFEKGLPYNSVEIQKAYIDLINSFINYARTSDKAAYLGLVIEEGIADALYRIPTGLVFYLSETNFKYISAPDIDVSSLTFIKYQKDKVINEKVLPFYAAMLIKRGIYLNRMGMHDEALRQYHRALELKKDKDTYELLADSYLLLGDKSKARFYYKYIIDNYGSTPQIEKKLTATMQ
jgi:tetratricopeptide (TPR) repeat protein